MAIGNCDNRQNSRIYLLLSRLYPHPRIQNLNPLSLVESFLKPLSTSLFLFDNQRSKLSHPNIPSLLHSQDLQPLLVLEFETAQPLLPPETRAPAISLPSPPLIDNSFPSPHCFSSWLRMLPSRQQGAEPHSFLFPLTPMLVAGPPSLATTS